ncbi:transposase [Defluviitalea raffinosedens]|uniref:Transposase n=1 Tax=Defluviitalea raffinosedens TaxID=1450156 RepID=A0A7C8HEZ7_9FIRM|nr:transposase [Defluviitalea raffinosedens]
MKKRNDTSLFSHKRYSYDNVCIESFHSILKKEEINHNNYYDFKSVRRELFEFIECWYNRKRIHESIH